MKWWDVRLNAPPPSSPSCQSRQRDDYSLMPRRQGNEISRSSSRSFSFSISASRRPLLWFVEAGKDFFFFFFIVITQNVLVWVWEAPTLLCGPRALLKFKEFPPTVHHFRLAVYMVLAGGRRVLIIPAVVFHPWTSIHPETPTPREDQRSSQTDLISLHRIYEYFYQPSFDLSVSVKHNSFLFYLNFFFCSQWPVGVPVCDLVGGLSDRFYLRTYMLGVFAPLSRRRVSVLWTSCLGEGNWFCT